MTVPNTAVGISFSQLNAELGLSPTATIGLSDAGINRNLTYTTPGTQVSVSLASNATFRIFTISTNTSNYNIATAFIAAGGAGVGNTAIEIRIQNNAILDSTTSNSAALDTDAITNYPSNVKLLTANVSSNSYILGMGGAGANTFNPAGGTGAYGGLAIRSRRQVNIINGGTISGGGGGGGGGGGNTPTPPTPSPPSPPGGGSCFLPNAMIELHGGHLIPIAYIKVGDCVTGAWGEKNRVIGFDRVPMHYRPMYLINDEHYTTEDHPYLAIQGFCAIDPASLKEDWGHTHPMTDEKNRLIEYRLNEGLDMNRLFEMKIGTILRHATGFKTVQSMEPVELESDTMLYNLVIDGSHTMRIDGYIVTAWPKESDFDYDIWTSR